MGSLYVSEQDGTDGKGALRGVLLFCVSGLWICGEADVLSASFCVRQAATRACKGGM